MKTVKDGQAPRMTASRQDQQQMTRSNRAECKRNDIDHKLQERTRSIQTNRHEATAMGLHDRPTNQDRLEKKTTQKGTDETQKDETKKERAKRTKHKKEKHKKRKVKIERHNDVQRNLGERNLGERKSLWRLGL
jgi:hypothetical protein